jgi:hypothetical protein
MRLTLRLLLALMLLLPAPAIAAEWGHYANVRFGYAIDVPPGFVGRGESANSDGQVFKSPTATLTVWGMYLLDGTFEDQARNRQTETAHDGWGISYSVSTPSNASFSGIKGGRIIYSRLIALCGSAFAEFDFEYSRADLQKFNSIVDRLVRSLRGTQGSVACPAQ